MSKLEFLSAMTGHILSWPVAFGIIAIVFLTKYKKNIEKLLETAEFAYGSAKLTRVPQPNLPSTSSTPPEDKAELFGDVVVHQTKPSTISSSLGPHEDLVEEEPGNWRKRIYKRIASEIESSGDEPLRGVLRYAIWASVTGINEWIYSFITPGQLLLLNDLNVAPRSVVG
jgi:hypothetical protein